MRPGQFSVLIPVIINNVNRFLRHVDRLNNTRIPFPLVLTIPKPLTLNLSSYTQSVGFRDGAGGVGVGGDMIVGGGVGGVTVIGGGVGGGLGIDVEVGGDNVGGGVGGGPGVGSFVGGAVVGAGVDGGCTGVGGDCRCALAFTEACRAQIIQSGLEFFCQLDFLCSFRIL